MKLLITPINVFADQPQMQTNQDATTKPPKKNIKVRNKFNQNFESIIEAQIKKPQEANWEHVKILALIRIKKAKHEKMMAKVNCQHKFETTVSKWRKIFKPIMKEGCSEHVKNGLTCKDKWNSITSNFKKKFDFMASIGQNQDY